MKYYLYYRDGYDSWGFESFDTKDALIAFVDNKRANTDWAFDECEYRVVKGTEYPVLPASYVKSVMLGNPE